jgi:ubiquinone/menaquinone biosynthesis C-methylase UbiE
MDLNNVEGQLFQCNGYNLDCIEDAQYDVVYSELVFEHIAVWEIRHSYLEEFLRVLKPGGEISILTKGGNGYSDRVMNNTSGWHENCYEAASTNGTWDCRIDDLFQVAHDLVDIGYRHPCFSLNPIPHEFTNFADHEFYVLITGYKPDENSGTG